MSEARLYDDFEDAANGEADKEANERGRILDALGMELSKTRSEAVYGRADCGIEDEWLEDEEFYEGIDDSNRGEMKAWWRQKPMGQAGPVIVPDGSNVFINISRPYADAAAARVGDMLLPTDDRGWSIGPTPVAELIDIADGKIPPHVEKQISQAYEGSPDQEAQVADVKTKLIDEVKAERDAAQACADKAQSRIEDWHVEGNYHARMRKVIESAARIGTGVLKGPIPQRRVRAAFKKGKIVKEDVMRPVSIPVDVWNCFPDPACGESVHDGSYHWERDDISPKRLQSLMDAGPRTKYIDEQIQLCLDEGPSKVNKEFKEGDGGRPGLIDVDKRSMFEIWYYYGSVTPEQLEAAGCDDIPTVETGKRKRLYPVMIEMVNNHVIKAVLNHLDTGEFPYDYMVWQQRGGLPWGRGVVRQMRTPQRIVNAATRNMMDNAGLAGGPMCIFKAGLVTPVDGVFKLAPRKLWRVSADEVIDDVAKAFTFVEVPMCREDLQAIIDMGMKLAEDVTGLPQLMQGQQGNAPETVGGMQILNNNASAVMRRIARLFDDLITEPHVKRYYTYLLQYGEEDDEKGEFIIDARGSSALVERDINNQVIGSMAQLVTNPIFGKDPKKWMDEWLKSQHLDPKRFDYDDDEWRKVVEGMAAAAQKGDSSVEVAQIRAQAMAQVEQFRQAGGDKDRALEQALATLDYQKEQQAREMEIALESVAREVEAADSAQDRQTEIDKLKTKLADTVMKLKTQREISMNNNAAKQTQASSPPTEPAGRAKAGQAYAA